VNNLGRWSVKEQRKLMRTEHTQRMLSEATADCFKPVTFPRYLSRRRLAMGSAAKPRRSAHDPRLGGSRAGGSTRLADSRIRVRANAERRKPARQMVKHGGDSSGAASVQLSRNDEGRAFFSRQAWREESSAV
jgi:hypothetical protein